MLGTVFSSGVFISHTARLRSENELTPGDSMSRHQYRKRYLGQVLDALPGAFEAKQLAVWIDRREVAAGDEFARAVCLALIRCSAAVVLVDKDALTSEYMQEEVRLLGWRKMLEPQLTILPVLLDVSAKDFATSPLGRAGGLAALSTLTPTSRKQNRTAAAQTAAEISDRVDVVPLSTKAAYWVNDVAHFIQPAPAHALTRAAEVLGISPDTLSAHHEKHALIAAALLNSTLADAFKVMREIAEYLPSRNLRSATNRVVPLWVDLEDARALMSVADAPQDLRIVHLISGLLPAEHAVQRASASQKNVHTADLGSSAGEEMVAELIARYDDQLRSTMNFNLDDGPDDIAHLLELGEAIVFALFKCDHLSTRVVREVLVEMMRRFPGIVFALVSARRVEHSVIRGKRILLAGDDRDGRDTRHLIGQMKALSSEPVVTDVN